MNLMKIKDSKAAIEFLNEAERYFKNRPTNGEDRAYWANVYNAENCFHIADLIEEKDKGIDRLRILKEAIWKIASTTAKNKDDHLMIAKQAIADYEQLGGTYRND